MSRGDRTPEQWQELVDTATKSLTRIAKLKRLSDYTDLNRDIAARTGQTAFDFSPRKAETQWGGSSLTSWKKPTQTKA